MLVCQDCGQSESGFIRTSTHVIVWPVDQYDEPEAEPSIRSDEGSRVYECPECDSYMVEWIQEG